jgi:hypothetical protein
MNSLSTFDFGLGPFVNMTKQTAVNLSLGPTVQVELSLGINLGGLNVKASIKIKLEFCNIGVKLMLTQIRQLGVYMTSKTLNRYNYTMP